MNFEELLKELIKEKGGTPEDYRRLLNLISFHETGGTMDPTTIQRSDKTSTGRGPGKGKYQFEGADGSNRLLTAANRTANYYRQLGRPVPEEILRIQSGDIYDATQLHPELQDTLVLGDLRMKGGLDLKDYASGKLSAEDLWVDHWWSGSKEKRPEQREKFVKDMKRYDAGLQNPQSEQPEFSLTNTESTAPKQPQKLDFLPNLFKYGGNMYPDGGSLNNGGGKKKPLYVDSEQHPRYQAYQDSLNVYNISQDWIKTMNEDGMTGDKFREFLKNKDNHREITTGQRSGSASADDNSMLASIERLKKLNDISGTGGWYIPTGSVSRDFSTPLSRMTLGFLGDSSIGSLDVYPKPKQPVIVGNEPQLSDTILGQVPKEIVNKEPNFDTDVVAYLQSQGQPHSYAERKRMFNERFPDEDYKGNADQNIRLLQSIKTGDVPETTTQTKSKPKSEIPQGRIQYGYRDNTGAFKRYDLTQDGRSIKAFEEAKKQPGFRIINQDNLTSQSGNQLAFGGNLYNNGGDLNKPLTTNSPEYAHHYKEGNIVGKLPGEDNYISSLPEMTLFSKGGDYPHYKNLSEQELKYFNDKGPMGRAVRAKATSGRTPNASDAAGMAGNLLGATGSVLQTPQSMMVEGIEGLSGNEYNLRNALPHTGKQRVPSDVWGYENPEGFWQHAANIGMDIVADPSLVTGGGAMSRIPTSSGVINKLARKTVKEAGEKTAKKATSSVVDAVGNYLTTQTPLKNAYKLNPRAFKPKEGVVYRGIGEEGMKDALESGVFRSPVGRNKTYWADAAEFQYAKNHSKTIGEDLKIGKSVIAEYPKGENIFHPEFKPWIKGQDAFYSEKNLPINEGKILKQDWLKGYKEVPKSTTSSVDDVGKGFKSDNADFYNDSVIGKLLHSIDKKRYNKKYPTFDKDIKDYHQEQIKFFETPEGKQRLANMGIREDRYYHFMNKINELEVKTEIGRGSHYSPYEGRIVIDPKNIKGVNASGEAIHDHELGHFIQDVRNSQVPSQFPEAHRAETISYTGKTNDWRNTLKGHSTNQMKPTWADVKLGELDLKHSGIPSKFKREISPSAKAYDYFNRASGIYGTDVDNMIERYPFLREFRQSLFESGLIKNKYDDVSSEILDEFAKKNPKNRINSIIQDSPKNKEIIKEVLKYSAGLAPIMGAAVQSEKEQNQLKLGGNLTNINPMNEINMFNEGGSHEANPLGGIPQGMGQNDQMNTVEEGEGRMGDMIYSDRIPLTEEAIMAVGLPKKFAGKTPAQALAEIDKIFKDRGDKAAQETKKDFADKIAQAQEMIKEQQAQIDQSMAANSQEIPDQMGGQIPPGMEEFMQPEQGGLPMEQDGRLQTGMQEQPQMFRMGGKMKPNRYQMGGGMTNPQLQREQNPIAGDADTNQAIDGVKSTVAGIGGPMFQLFQGIQKLGQKGGEAIGGEGGAAVSDLFSPEESTIAMWSDKDATPLEKFGGTVPILGGVLAHRAKKEKESERYRREVTGDYNRRNSDFAYGGKIDPKKKNIQEKRGVPQDSLNLLPENRRADYKRNYKALENYKESLENMVNDISFTKIMAKLGNKESKESMKDYKNKLDSIPHYKRMMFENMTNPEYKGDAWYSANNKAYGGKINKFRWGGDDKNKSYYPEVDFPTQPYDSSNETLFTDGQYDRYKNLSFTPDGKTHGSKPSEDSNSGNKLGNIGNALLRGAPVIMNALQLRKAGQYDKVTPIKNTTRFNPKYSDEKASQNLVNEQMNDYMNRMTQMGGSVGQMRSLVGQGSLNKTRALGERQMADRQSDNQVDMYGQQFNNQNTEANIARQIGAEDRTAMNKGAAATNKSRLLAQIGQDLGNIGKENMYKEIAKITGYDWLGNFIKRNPNASEEELIAEAQKYVGGGQSTTEPRAYGGKLKLKRY